MTNDEIKALLDEIYGGDSYKLLDKVTCGDSTIYTDEERQFDLVAPAYLYLCLHYAGQDSKEYEQLCRLLTVFNPKVAPFKPGDDDDCNNELYRHLTQQRPFRVKYGINLSVEVEVWATSLDDAESKATAISVEVTPDASVDIDVVVKEAEINDDDFTTFETEDIGPFVEDEPEEYCYDWQYTEGALLIWDKESGKEVYMQGEEGSQLYEQLEAMKCQSHINTTLGEYFNA